MALVLTPREDSAADSASSKPDALMTAAASTWSGATAAGGGFSKNRRLPPRQSASSSIIGRRHAHQQSDMYLAQTGSVALVAGFFAQQQARLRRNMVVASDSEWTEDMKGLAKKCCGAFIFFKKSGCCSCNCMAPKVHEASVDFEISHGSDVMFIEVDIDKCPKTARSFNIDFAPSFCVLSHGGTRETFTGVSSAVFKDHVDRLSKAMAICGICNEGARNSFDAMRSHLPDVVKYGCLDDGTLMRVLKASVPNGDQVPSGQVIMPFDAIHSAGEFIDYRLELLADFLRRPAPQTHRGGNMARVMVFDMLSDMADQSLDVAKSVRGKLHAWLVNKCGHPSLWSVDEWSALALGTDAFAARRSVRSEFWLLSSIKEVTGRQSAIKYWSPEVRKELNKYLEDLWSQTRPCNRLCSCCELPCALSLGHREKHSCGSQDHQCHRMVAVPAPKRAEEASGEQEVESTVRVGSKNLPRIAEEKCYLHAGHRGPCRRKPSLLGEGEVGICSICLDAAVPKIPRAPLASARRQSKETVAERQRCVLEEELVTLPCGHVFHAACAGPWLDRSQSCPVCRSPTSKKGGVLLGSAEGGLTPRRLGGDSLAQPRRIRRIGDRDRDRDTGQPQVLEPLGAAARSTSLAFSGRQLGSSSASSGSILRQPSVGVLRPRDVSGSLGQTPLSGSRNATESSSATQRLGALPPLHGLQSLPSSLAAASTGATALDSEAVSPAASLAASLAPLTVSSRGSQGPK